MPACLVTGHPRATSTGPLAQPGPKPSPARVQGPQAGPTSPSPAAVPKGRKPTWAGCPQASRPCDGVRHCCPSAGLWEPHGDGTAALHPPIPSIPTLPPQGKELASASCFPPAAPQDAMQSSLMHLDSFMGMRKCFQVSHKVPLRSQYGSLFLVPRIDNAFPSHPGAPAPRGTLSASTHCREWGCVWGHVWGCGAAATSLCSQRSWVQGGARPHPTSQPGCSFRMQGAEHGPILQTNLGAAISGARGFAQHPRVQPCIPSRGFCSGASAQLNLAGNRRRRVLCIGAGDTASMHTHGCRTPGSTAFPTALPISGSCWQSQSNAAALHTSRAEGYLSIAMTSAGALLLPLWVRHSPDLVKRLRRRSAELLSLSALTAPPGFDFKDCTHTEDPSQQQNAIGLQGTG